MAKAIHQRGLQRYAGGGFISSLFGTSKPETVTEKFARQDAEFRAKHPERFQTPEASKPTGTSAISSYAGMSAMKDREKAAGLKAGGMVKKCVTGGEIEGPGGPTDDLVPIMASNGEFMIKASSAKILGEDVLEALNDLGDEPKNPKDDAAEDSKEKMKCGGAVKKKMADGGLVQDPLAGQYGHAAIGAPVDQGAAMDRSILASNAEASAQSTETETPSIPKRSSYTDPAQMAVGMPNLFANGGMIRKLAAGGYTDPLDKRVSKIPAGGTAPAPDGLSNGNDFTRNMNTNLNALGGMGVVASVPLKAAAAVPAGLGAIQSSVRAAPMLANGVPGANFIAGANSVRQVGGANLPAVINSSAPVAKTVNVALQEGAKANQMAAGVRSFGNASAGAGMLDGQQQPLEQVPKATEIPQAPQFSQAPQGKTPMEIHQERIASAETQRTANAGTRQAVYSKENEQAYLDANDKANALKPSYYSQETPTSAQNRVQADQDATAALNNIYSGSASASGASRPTTATTPNPVAQAQPSLPANYRGKGYTDPRQLGVSAPNAGQPNTETADEFSNAAIAQRNPGGMVRKVVGADGRTSYSGGNVSGEVSFQGADGNALPGRPGGGFMTYGGMSPETIKQTLTNPDGSQWSAGDNAIMAANIRDGVDKYRGTSRDPRNDPMNQPMTKDQRAARVQMAQIASQDKRYGEQNAIAQENLGMSRTEHAAKMTKDKQIADVQAEYMAAQGDPAKEAIVKRKMLALGLLKQNDQQDEYVTNVVTDANGVQSVVATNKRTGQVQGGKQAQTYDTWKANLLAHPANKGQTAPSEQQLQAEYAKQFPKG